MTPPQKLLIGDDERKGVLGRSAVAYTCLVVVVQLLRAWLDVEVDLREFAAHNIERWAFELAGACGFGAIYNRTRK